MTTARAHILHKYHVAPDARLGGGMEAEVFAYGEDAVLKLYDGTTSLADLLTLQGFYAALDRQRVPYALPRIHTVAQEGQILITIEQRLPGTPLATLLPGYTAAQRDTAMQRYLAASLALAAVPPPPGWNRHKLFDPDRLSARADGDWHAFLSRLLAHRLPQVAPHLQHDVPQFAANLPRLHAVLAQPYRGAYRLIHGDFCPGNLLIDADQQVSALLDFGMLTMVGDPLFDAATSWVFFDMYDDLNAHVRERYEAMLLNRLGEAARGPLYRYVLLYSILSANMYAADCSDGHGRWCVANLNMQHYWDALA